MKSRCDNPNNSRYKNYGGRGITVCNEWKDNFIKFYEWAKANGYNQSLTLDRVDVNGDYEPTNCKWSTPKEQANNRTNNHLVPFNGEILTISQWAAKLNINRDVLYHRIITRKWSIERALTTPVVRKGVV